MHGFPLDTAKAMLERLLSGLRPSDTFNVLLFSGSNRMLNDHSVPATRANIEQALATIKNYSGGGSTELIPALKRVYAEPKAANVSRSIVVVTDGYVTVEREAFELVRRNLDKANLFSFGIGSSVNRHLMEGLARAGMGEPFVITDPMQAAREAARFRRMIESPCIKVCTLDPKGEVCLGCFRTLAEIGRWAAMSDRERTEVIARLEGRRNEWRALRRAGG